MVGEIPIHQYVVQFALEPDNLCDDYFHFTVVRHPLARLVSHYRQQIDGQPAFSLIEDRSIGGQTYDTFRDFAELVLLNNPNSLDAHVAPMFPAIDGIRLDMSLTTTSMNHMWNTLPIQGNVPLPDRGRKDTKMVSCCADWPSERFLETNERPPWQCYYDSDLRKDAIAYFSQDVSRWFSEESTQ